MKTWYENLRNAVKRSGMTQAELAERVGVSTATVSQWLSGGRTPSVIAIKKLASVLAMSVSEMIGDDKTILENQGERDLIDAFRGLNDTQKETLQKVLEALKATESKS